MRARFWRRSAEMSCKEVGRVLQQFLDGTVDDVSAHRIRRHLDACRRCGLEATTYEEIKAALRRRVAPDDDAIVRLRAFGDSLASGEGFDEDDGEEHG